MNTHSAEQGRFEVPDDMKCVLLFCYASLNRHNLTQNSFSPPLGIHTVGLGESISRFKAFPLEKQRASRACSLTSALGFFHHGRRARESGFLSSHMARMPGAERAVCTALLLAATRAF